MAQQASGNRGNFANNRERAAAAGRKGGQASRSTGTTSNVSQDQNKLRDTNNKSGQTGSGR